MRLINQQPRRWRSAIALMGMGALLAARGASAEPVPEAVTQGTSVELGVGRNVSPDTGWALGASIGGFSAAGLTLTLALAAEVENGNTVPAMTLGGLATSLVAVGGPVVFLGGASARQAAPDGGSLGLRLTGWITYGLSLADATALLALGASRVTVPTGVITSTGLLGATSLVCFSLDALFSRNSALRARVEISRGDSGIEIVPMASTARLPDGSIHPTLGFVALF